MKLFQQLLLAPAALGLLAPLAATAAEVNINDVANYAKSPNQAQAVKSVQFSDVVPGDWAYTALQNLSESYGCVDNAYTQNLKSGQALTRFEAAALVNACLEGGMASAEANADFSRLSNEFGTEMAILKGSAEGLESKVTELSAGQFSGSTKIDNKVVFNTGYVDNDQSNANDNKLTTSFMTQTNVNTSFSGKDRLYTRIKSGNMANTDWESTTYGTHLASAHKSEDATSGSPQIVIDKLWYERPVGDSFKVWAGPLIENYYMLASSPSIYKPVLKQFALGGNGPTYGSSTDGGFGAAWIQNVEDRSAARFAVSSNYVAKSSETSTGGILTGETQAKWLSKLEYGSPKWQVSLAYAKNICTSTNSCKSWQDYYTTELAEQMDRDANAYALRAYYRPDAGPAVPDIQIGYETMTSDSPTASAGKVTEADSWMVGLMWSDAFIDGNRLGFAFGQPLKATAVDKVPNGSAWPSDVDPFTWELYYDYKVSDGITITPTIFGAQDRYDGTTGENDLFGALVQTTFKF
ncbi:iron uptake porin [Prochlorococcus sp. MIT 0603]|uniref:iron uptake porin n=2 Tax=Prochlorococcus TaxID=1218 RepID=UPI0039A5E4F0